MSTGGRTLLGMNPNRSESVFFAASQFLAAQVRLRGAMDLSDKHVKQAVDLAERVVAEVEYRRAAEAPQAPVATGAGGEGDGAGRGPADG